MMSKQVKQGVFMIRVIVLWVVLLAQTSACFAQFSIENIKNRVDTIEDLHKKASSLLFVAEYYLQDQPDSAIRFADQALDIALMNNDSLCIVDAYKCLSVSSAGIMNCSQSEAYFLAGLPFAVNTKDSASFYADMGASFTICGNLQKAARCYSIARKMYIRIDDKRNLAGLITNNGVMHARNSNYYQASECYLEALVISEEMNDEELIAGIYQNMGEVMALQKQYDKAVGYFNSALNRFEKLERHIPMAGLYLNLGQIYIEQEQWDVAKHYLNKSYVIDTTYKLKNFESIALKLLGITYLRIDKLESAERLITEALRMQKVNGYATLIGHTSTMLAEVYFEQGRYTEALTLLKDAESNAVKSGDDGLLANTLSLKSKILAHLKQFDHAYKALKQSRQMEDSIFNIETSKSIMNLELAYQTEKKEKQIDELKFNDSLRKEQLGKRTFQVYLLIVSVILLAVMLVSLIFFWLKRQQMENQKRERRFLQGRFEAEERAKDEIAHELHDDIGGQLIGIILQLQTSQNLNDAELKLLQNVYRDVRRLSHSLDEPLFIGVTLQEKARNYLSELKEFVSFKSNFIDDLTLDWGKVANQQELQRNIYRIIQELITNTIKFANASVVDIQMLNEGNTFVLIYEDNGVGMPSEKPENKQSFNTIRKRTEMFGGIYEMNTYPNEGVFVKISIPFSVI